MNYFTNGAPYVHALPSYHPSYAPPRLVTSSTEDTDAMFWTPRVYKDRADNFPLRYHLCESDVKQDQPTTRPTPPYGTTYVNPTLSKTNFPLDAVPLL